MAACSAEHMLSLHHGTQACGATESKASDLVRESNKTPDIWGSQPDPVASLEPLSGI